MSDSNGSGGIMAIGAHAGDVENMAAAAILVHTRAGFKATAVHMTLGEAGHPTLAPEVYAEQRRAEAQASAGLMGAGLVCLPYRDGRLPAYESVKLAVCDLIRRERPAIVLTHWKGSIHQDHVATYQVVCDAVGYAASPALERGLPAHQVEALYFAENWEDMEGWRPGTYLDATEVWEQYLAVLRSHQLMRGGVSRFRYADYYDALGTVRGCLGGFGKAVALMPAAGSEVRRVRSLLPAGVTGGAGG